MQVAKGMCAVCNEPVTNFQRRNKLPDGRYVHEPGPDGKCFKKVLQQEPSGDMLLHQVQAMQLASNPQANVPAQNKGICRRCGGAVLNVHARSRLADGTYEHNLNSFGVCNLELSSMHATQENKVSPPNSKENESRGACRRCQQPVLTQHARVRMPDGLYEHQTGPDGKCVLVNLGLQRQPSEEAAGKVLSPKTSDGPAQKISPTAMEMGAVNLNSPLGAHGAQNILELKGTCTQCQQQVLSSHKRVKLPGGAYTHEIGPNGKCNTTRYYNLPNPPGVGQSQKQAALPVNKPQGVVDPTHGPTEAKAPKGAAPATSGPGKQVQAPPGSPARPSAHTSRAAAMQSAEGLPGVAREPLGICPACLQPITSNQMRFRRPDGQLAHEIGTDGRCIHAVLEDTQSVHSGGSDFSSTRSVAFTSASARGPVGGGKRVTFPEGSRLEEVKAMSVHSAESSVYEGSVYGGSVLGHSVAAGFGGFDPAGGLAQVQEHHEHAFPDVPQQHSLQAASRTAAAGGGMPSASVAQQPRHSTVHPQPPAGYPAQVPLYAPSSHGAPQQRLGEQETAQYAPTHAGSRVHTSGARLGTDDSVDQAAKNARKCRMQ